MTFNPSKIKLVSFDGYDTILSITPYITKIGHLFLKNSDQQSINDFVATFNKEMDKVFKSIVGHPFQPSRFLYERVFASDLLTDFIKVSAHLAVDAIYEAHSNAIALPGIRELIKQIRNHYHVAVLSDADTVFLHGSLARNDINVDLVITSEQPKDTKLTLNVTFSNT